MTDSHDLTKSFYECPDFQIWWRWKEGVEYWEGARGVSFMAGWGVKPYAMPVPSASSWDAAVPDWLRGRHSEVTERLRRHSGHLVEETDQRYGVPVVMEGDPGQPRHDPMKATTAVTDCDRWHQRKIIVDTYWTQQPRFNGRSEIE